MNRKIQLYFSKKTLIDPKSGIELHKGIRLLGIIQFLSHNSWNDPEYAIIDTGAPISLVPQYLWENSAISVMGDTELRGVIQKKECILPVKVAKIILRLMDIKYLTKEIEIKAYLAPNDNVPLIIGFEDLLSEFDIFFSYSSQEAFIKAGK